MMCLKRAPLSSICLSVRLFLSNQLEKCFLHYNTLWVIPSDERERAVNQVRY